MNNNNKLNMSNIYIIYCFNLDENSVELCCYTESHSSAINALDDYAVSKFRLLEPNFPTEKNPFDMDFPEKYRYYIKLNYDHENTTEHGESERIDIYNNNGEQCFYFKLQKLNKYIDDYLKERTEAVIQLERDNQGIINVDTDDEDD